MPFELEEGTCYLVRGKAVETSYRLFRELVDQGLAGLCVSRLYPDRVRSRYGLALAPIWWITHSPGDERFDPSVISTLLAAIEAFIESHPGPCVVLLDGVEFIMNNIGFPQTLFFVERLNEFVMPRRTIVLLPVDADCFEGTEFARLDRFLEGVDEGALRKLLDSHSLSRRLLVD